MFLQYWPLGLWAVTYGTFLDANTGEQGAGIFSAGFVGFSASAGAIGGLLAPILVGWIADRFFAAERVLSLLHLVAAGAVWWMFEAGTQAGFFAAMLLYYQMFVPTVSLTNTIALRALADPSREFPVVRMFGTVAWIARGRFPRRDLPVVVGRVDRSDASPVLAGQRLARGDGRVQPHVAAHAAHPQRRAGGGKSIHGGAAPQRAVHPVLAGVGGRVRPVPGLQLRQRLPERAWLRRRRGDADDRPAHRAGVLRADADAARPLRAENAVFGGG